MKPCIQAAGPRNDQGYAKVRTEAGKDKYAHRDAYEVAVGPIPAGMVVDHLCHNADATCPGGNACAHRGCIEATHLALAPRGVNAMRGGRRNRTGLCNHGHDLAAHGYPRAGRLQSLNCRECERERRHRNPRTPEQKAARRAAYAARTGEYARYANKPRRATHAA